MWTAKAEKLKKFICTELFSEKTGFFHDIWSVKNENPPLAFEGFFALVVGAATPEQARRVIDENLLNPERFFTPHPISTVGRCDPNFEMRMWRGPAWNSMTFWAALGCLRYGRKDAAAALLEKALDNSAFWFERTGTIWEYYDSLGGDPSIVKRKPGTERPTACRDYVGHNPLIAMSRLWEKTKAG